jgi:hypothetical protein
LTSRNFHAQKEIRACFLSSRRLSSRRRPRLLALLLLLAVLRLLVSRSRR